MVLNLGGFKFQSHHINGVEKSSDYGISSTSRLNKIKQASIENKEEIKSIFSPYIGKMINLGDNKHIAKVENIKTNTDLKLEVVFNMYNKNNLYKSVSTFLKTFENILFYRLSYKK
ncbi:hypothetical protein F1B92_04745 [Campylobacter sp. FMV-PI01]|uniref:Uncharacterized protein n=1 Tax=Campylobacter portucalensis TaxID=2608384 RepID=A0A6L5WH16_9BACT|nr:hypothetical protein [Campylobacter portucalensis]MSN96480.1 hypothetical protein [Campylobacter portucalensis]